MNPTAFDTANPDTWPELMSSAEVAALWGFAVVWLNKRVAKGRFAVAPVERHPNRWRKIDIVRYLRPDRPVRLESGRAHLRHRSA